jgi:hypothetical protein
VVFVSWKAILQKTSFDAAGDLLSLTDPAMNKTSGSVPIK